MTKKEDVYRVEYEIESESSFSGSVRQSEFEIEKERLRFDPEDDDDRFRAFRSLVETATYNDIDELSQDDCPPADTMFPELNLDDKKDKDSIDWDEVQWDKLYPIPDCDMEEAMSDEGGVLYRHWDYWVQGEGNGEWEKEREYDEKLTLKIKVYDGSKRLKVEDLYIKSKGDDYSK